MPTFTGDNVTEFYSPPAGVKRIKIELHGENGRSGGSVSSFSGGSGGSGGYSEGVIDVSSSDQFRIELAGAPNSPWEDGGKGAAGSGRGPNDFSNQGKDGGDGAGASRVVRENDSNTLLIAEGGGGGSGANSFAGSGAGGGGARGGSGGSGTNITFGASTDPGEDGSGSGSGGDGGDGVKSDSDGNPGGDGGATYDGSALISGNSITGGSDGNSKVVITEGPIVPTPVIESSGDTSADVIVNGSNFDNLSLEFREDGSSFSSVNSYSEGNLPTTETVTSLTPDTEYEFRVSGTNPVGTSTSGTVTARTLKNSVFVYKNGQWGRAVGVSTFKP